MDASGHNGEAGKQLGALVGTLFDRQNSGGLRGGLPRDAANRVVAALHKDGQTAAITCTLDFTNTGVHLTGNM